MNVAPTIVKKSKYCIDSPLGPPVTTPENKVVTIWKSVERNNSPVFPLLFSAVSFLALPRCISLPFLPAIFAIFYLLSKKTPIIEGDGKYLIRFREPRKSTNITILKEVLAELNTKPFFHHWLSAKKFTIMQAEMYFENYFTRGLCFGQSCARLSQLVAGKELDSTPDEKKVYLHQILNHIDITFLNYAPILKSEASQQQLDDIKECQDLLYRVANPASIKFSHHIIDFYSRTPLQEVDKKLQAAMSSFFPYTEAGINTRGSSSTLIDNSQQDYEKQSTAQKVDLEWHKHYLCGLITMPAGTIAHTIAFNVTRDAVFVYNIQEGYSKVPPQHFSEFIINEIKSDSPEKWFNVELFLVDKVNS